MNIVILAEKSNAAKDIAEALELENLKKIENGFYSGVKNNNSFVITFTQGHCSRLKEPKEIDVKYEKWSLETLPIPFSDNELKPLSEKKNIVRAIKTHIKKADIIINAGDAGREGELIQRWALKITGYNGEIGRLWASSLTKKAIQTAFDNIIGYNEDEKKVLDNLYNAGEARAVMDKYLGYNYSRLISLAKTENITVNYGRCKTPLINSIIKRDDEINNFVKKNFYYIRLELDDKINAIYVDKNLKRIEFEDNKDAITILNNVGDQLKIVDLKEIEKENWPPMPFDILNLQKQLAKKYNFEADKTLTLCQRLYDQHKILSYPRTDSRYLTSDLMDNIKENLMQLNFGKFKEYINIAEKRNIHKKYFNDKKVADHHALIPIVPDNKSLEEIYNEDLSEDEKKVFDEIAKNFISLFLLPAKDMIKTIVLKDDKNYFLSKGREVVELGYKICYQNEDINDDDNLESILGKHNIADILNVKNKNIIKGETKPKSHFTTETLLDFMKIHGIGTGATRDKLIKELTEKKGNNNDSAIVKEGRYYIATNFGRKVDEVIPKHLKSIELLSSLEEKLTLIENGQLKKEVFLKNIEDMFLKDLEEMKDEKNKLIIKKEIKTVDLYCPICKKPLREISKGYGCTGWKKDSLGCDFFIPKEIAGKKLSIKVIRELLLNGKTSKPMKGFKSKKGNIFDAYLILDLINDKGVVKFDFSQE